MTGDWQVCAGKYNYFIQILVIHCQLKILFCWHQTIFELHINIAELISIAMRELHFLSTNISNSEPFVDQLSSGGIHTAVDTVSEKSMKTTSTSG